MQGSTELSTGLADADELFALAVEEDDAPPSMRSSRSCGFEKIVAGLEFRRMFSGEMDTNSAYRRYSVGCRRDRGSGLGGNDFAHVSALGGSAWLQGRGY